MKHPWLTEPEDIGKTPNLSLQELTQIIFQWRKVQLLIELQSPSEIPFESVLDALKSVLPCCEN